MSILQKITNILKRYIIKRASEHKAVDIVEVRTKQIGLLSVRSETDLCIRNSFFLPYTLLSIETDLLNKDGLKVGKMTFDKATKVKAKSELVFTTTSEISIITSLFQALSNLLSQTIWMRSVGIAKVKVLWFTVELPVDDVFEIQPSKLKITKEETEEEKAARLEKEAVWKAKYETEKEQRKRESIEKREAWKEEILKKRYKENYIPKDQRALLKKEQNPMIETLSEDKVVADENIVIEMNAALLAETDQQLTNYAKTETQSVPNTETKQDLTNETEDNT